MGPGHACLTYGSRRLKINSRRTRTLRNNLLYLFSDSARVSLLRMIQPHNSFNLLKQRLWLSYFVFSPLAVLNGRFLVYAELDGWMLRAREAVSG